MTHLTIEINERRDGDYTRCRTCGERTALVIASTCWDVDSEAFSEGEDDALAPDSVEIDEEITGHYCFKCGRLTSLSFNAQPIKETL